MAIESMIHSRMSQAETEAELELVTTLAEMDEGDEGDPLEVATAAMLEQVAGAMMKRSTLTPADAKRLLTESPGLLHQLAADQEVVGLFLGALQAPPPAPDGLADDLAAEGLADDLAASEPPPAKK